MNLFASVARKVVCLQREIVVVCMLNHVKDQFSVGTKLSATWSGTHSHRFY